MKVYNTVMAHQAATTAPFTEWTHIPELVKQPRRFVYVSYESVRWVSRWNTVENKRPFKVYSRRRFSSAQMSAHKTFEAAWKAAQKVAKELEEIK